MPKTLDITQTIKDTSGTATTLMSKTLSVASEDVKSSEMAIIANQTDKLINFAMDVSQNKVLVLLSTQNCTIETNSGSSPGATITLVANKPLVWHDASYFTHPFGSTDVTALYITNVLALTLTIIALDDITP